MKKLRIATRPSKLAVTQSGLVADLLRAKHPDLSIELIEVSTRGDKDQLTPIREFGGAGAFVKELEKAILDGRADMAVHSLKDVPSEQIDDLELVSYPPREDVRDVLITREGLNWRELKQGAVVGTSSPGRLAQLKRLRPDLQFKEIRGNVESRIAKVERGDYDATILAAAGLNRLGISFLEKSVFLLREMVPSPGQGALVLQCCLDDDVARIARSINDTDTELAVWHERQFMELMEGGCRHPLAANIAVWGDDVAYRFLVGDKHSYEFEEVYGTCYVRDLDDLVKKQSDYFKTVVKERNFIL